MTLICCTTYIWWLNFKSLIIYIKCLRKTVLSAPTNYLLILICYISSHHCTISSLRKKFQLRLLIWVVPSLTEWITNIFLIWTQLTFIKFTKRILKLLCKLFLLLHKFNSLLIISNKKIINVLCIKWFYPILYNLNLM